MCPSAKILCDVVEDAISAITVAGADILREEHGLDDLFRPHVQLNTSVARIVSVVMSVERLVFHNNIFA